MNCFFLSQHCSFPNTTLWKKIILLIKVGGSLSFYPNLFCLTFRVSFWVFAVPFEMPFLKRPHKCISGLFIIVLCSGWHVLTVAASSLVCYVLWNVPIMPANKVSLTGKDGLWGKSIVLMYVPSSQSLTGFALRTYKMNEALRTGKRITCPSVNREA